MTRTAPPLARECDGGVDGGRHGGRLPHDRPGADEALTHLCRIGGARTGRGGYDDLVTRAHELRGDGGGVSPAEQARDVDVRPGQGERLDGLAEAPGRERRVEAVDDDERPAADDLEAAGPAYAFEALAHGPLRQHLSDRRERELGGAHGGGGVLRLVTSQQREPEPAVRAQRRPEVEHLPIEVLGDDAQGALFRHLVQRRARLADALRDRLDGGGAHRSGDHLARPGDDAGLLLRDRGDGVAEDGGVFQVNRRDDRYLLGGECVGRVEPAAETDLDDLPVATGLLGGEPAEDRDQLEV